MTKKLDNRKYKVIEEIIKLEDENLLSALEEEIAQAKEEEKETVLLQPHKNSKSNFGSAKGLILMSEDFDSPLKDFKEYM